MNIVILPEQVLQVMWVPAVDASRSPVTNIINVIVKRGADEPVTKSVQHPITIATINGLPEYSSGKVSLQARNPGALSKAITKTFRMVNISGEGWLIRVCTKHLGISLSCNNSTLQ